jgi:hypothetical protein
LEQPPANFTSLRLDTSVFFYDHQPNGVFKIEEKYAIRSGKMVVSNVVGMWTKHGGLVIYKDNMWERRSGALFTKSVSVI